MRLNDIPEFIPISTREIMIISKELAALLVRAKSAPDMRKMLFNNKHFFLGREKEDKVDIFQTMVRTVQV